MSIHAEQLEVRDKLIAILKSRVESDSKLIELMDTGIKLADKQLQLHAKQIVNYKGIIRCKELELAEIKTAVEGEKS